METQNKFDQDITAASDGAVAKKLSPKANVAGGLLIIIGIALLLARTSLGESVASNAFFSTFGIISVLAGLVLLIWFGRSLCLISTGSPVRQNSVYFDTHDLQTLSYLIETADFQQLDKVKKGNNIGIRMDTTISKDGCFVALQLFRYVPHNYELASPMYFFHKGDARKFLDSFTGLGA